ncbi:histidine phosphatase family protein [Actinokineospora iranica]|uniref:Broad specificity phosphatase PhoE n=1 Tax=Actinokineospora iranica TaxID=1271860 RepID=A0A1G6J4V1_9PSEU|nr:histidine phosphatase family protein [Actinokineospora iranica]SDC13852.1 Broad specificity phosphatase PhoE [Actinokineospora iranica]
MSARLILVCHGATAATRAAAFPADEPLERNAVAAATAGPPLGQVDEALCAPALRCAQTAAALGLLAKPDEGLRDADFGRWRGHALDELAVAEPDELTRWLTDPRAAPHGGESVVDLVARVGRWLDDRPTESPRTVAVTHPAVVKAALIHALGADPSAFWRIDVAPLSRTILRGGPGRWTLRWIVPGTA